MIHHPPGPPRPLAEGTDQLIAQIRARERVWHSRTRVGAVDAPHAVGLAAAGTDEGAPGPRPDYGPEHYGAFLRDPDGHKVEAAIVPGAS